MSGWLRYLKADPTDWLLEESNPSVRYFTLIDLLGESPKAPAVRRARQRIMQDGVVPRILAKQHAGGHWEKPENFYMCTKYRGTVWTLIVLASLGASRLMSSRAASPANG